jgi:hypothetical protein
MYPKQSTHGGAMLASYVLTKALSFYRLFFWFSGGEVRLLRPVQGLPELQQLVQGERVPQGRAVPPEGRRRRRRVLLLRQGRRQEAASFSRCDSLMDVQFSNAWRTVNKQACGFIT